MNRKFSVLVVLFFTVSIYAQNSKQNEHEAWKLLQNEYKNFDIGKYKTPDIVRNQLDNNFYFHSDYSRIDNSYPDRESKREGSNLNGYISSSFLHYVNTRKKISSFTGRLFIREDYSSTKDRQTFTVDHSTAIGNVSNLSQQNSLGLNWSNQWYFSKLFYMEYDLQGDASYYFIQDKTKNQSEEDHQKQKVFSSIVSPRLGIGYGRIENVRDARQAVYIANALSQKKVLSRNLSDDELFELSQIISTVKNKRFLDSRLRLIEEITTLDTFFENNQLLEDNGAAYFTTLYDMWQYGDLFERQSGYEISFIVRPAYSYRNVEQTPEIQDAINHSWQHLMILNFSYEKPFKLNWQHSLSAMISGGINSSSERNKQIDYKNSTQSNSLAASAVYSFGYYPNTRTNIRIATSQQISKNRYKDDRSLMNFYSTLGAQLYYYFSPNLRLAGDCNLIYSPGRLKWDGGYYDNRNNFISTFNIQLTYFIF